MGSYHEIVLERFAYTDKFGVFGKIHIGNSCVLYTLEQGWNYNLPFHSCLPEGEYAIVPFYSMKFQMHTYVLVNEQANVHVAAQPDPRARYACIFHPANQVHELQGCIAVGMAYGTLDGTWALKDSRQGLSSLLKFLDISSVRQLRIRHYQFGY